MRLLTIGEVASVLNVPRARAYELVRRGALPCVRLLRQVRVAEDALRTFVATGGTDGASQPTLPPKST